MGKDLHHTILPFLEKNLTSHPMVVNFEKIETEDNFLYKINRIKKKSLLIRVCDAYCFSGFDYYNKPEGIDFIYIARPEASDFYYEEECKRDGINMGKFGALMGVLYQDNIADYVPVDRRKKEDKKN